MWYEKYGSFVMKLGFITSVKDNCVYFECIYDHILIVVLYVNDMLFLSNS